MSFTVAIVGRPNVGKSTLYNRLTGKRHALVDDMPGVTRDRRYGEANLGGLEFRIIDTAGLDDAKEGTLAARMTDQTRRAICEADVAMMIVDGRSGITPTDKYFASEIRKLKKPVVLVVNKAEGNRASTAIGDAFSLGLGEPVAISAEHGEGLVDLYEALVERHKALGLGLKEKEENDDSLSLKPQALSPLQLAIVGRPNVGKSTIINKILGEERVLTGPEAGITRDAIMIEHDYKGRKLKLVDTAGMRRKSNVVGKVEKLAVADSLMAVQYAHVVVVMIDATMPLEKQDNTIAALIEQEGRAMVLAVNKWDLVEEKDKYLEAINLRLSHVLPQVKDIPVVTLSAQKGLGIHKLLEACFKAYTVWNREIPTGELNRWLEGALEQYTPPLVKGRRIKIRYMTQKSARPPSFILFSNTSDIPDHYTRYLLNSMRETFNLPGVPIRFRIKKGDNPYAKSE
jgi:GTP-binding protein